MRYSIPIPNQVLIHIVSHIPESNHDSLYACLLSCRALYDIASLPLYRTVHLSSHKLKSPFYDANNGLSSSKKAAAKSKGVVGKKAGGSRKWHLLSLVKVLELDGRMGGPFWDIKEGSSVLPSLRTLRVDMTHDKSSVSWKQESRYASFGAIKPKTIVLKHLAFHATTSLLDLIPESTLSHVTRVIYLIEYKPWDEDLGRNNTYLPFGHTPFGLPQWLSSFRYAPYTLATVDIVFWTPNPGPLFVAPSNKYTHIQVGPGQTWLDAYLFYVGKTADVCCEKMRVNFINTGSFDRGAVSADVWEYGVVQEAVRARLACGIRPAQGREFRMLSMPEWLEDMRKGGIFVGDVLTDEELESWSTEQ